MLAIKTESSWSGVNKDDVSVMGPPTTIHISKKVEQIEESYESYTTFKEFTVSLLQYSVE